MKTMGVNAIRTSHNPPSPELLDLCDRLGLVVMDEAFDMWRVPKVANGYSKYFDTWSERDVRDFVRRDRNHPSVIMWSIGNEVPEQSRSVAARSATPSNWCNRGLVVVYCSSGAWPRHCAAMAKAASVASWKPHSSSLRLPG